MRKLLITATTLGVTFVSCGVALANPVTFNFSGHVISDLPAQLALFSNNTVSGSYTFDSNTIGSGSVPTQRTYGLTSMTVGLSSGASLTYRNSDWLFQDIMTGTFGHYVVGGGCWCSKWGEILPGIFIWNVELDMYENASHQALATTDLMLTPPDIKSFSGATGAIAVLDYKNGPSPDTPLSFIIGFQLTDLTVPPAPIPEPGSLFLLASSLAGLAGIRFRSTNGANRGKRLDGATA